MFERFSDSARHVLTLAQDEAVSLGHDFIGTEHLLLGLAADGDSRVARMLARHGLRKGRIRSYVCLLVGPAAPTARVDPRIDPTALATLGIDLDEVRCRVEAAFGRGALGPRKPGKAGDACTDMRLTARTKQVFELALREAQREHVEKIEPEHIALALLQTDGIAARLLAHHRVTRAVMRAALRDGPDQVAS